MGSEEELNSSSLLESEELFGFALEISRMGVWELSLDDHTASRTLGHDRIFGYQTLLPSWTYETFLGHVLDEDRALVETKFNAAVENRSDWNFECRIRRADGAIRWIWAAGRHRTNNTGRRVMSGVVQDITTQKNAELRLIESERRLKAIMSAAPIGISFSDDATCERITGNRVLLSQFEASETDNVSLSTTDPTAVGKRVRIYERGQEVSGEQLPLQRAIRERRDIGPVDLEILLPSGRRWIAETYGAPVLGENGEALGGVAVTVDVTERRAFEEALSRSERQERQSAAELQTLLDTAPIGVAIALDAKGETIRGNRANEEMFGLGRGAQFSMTGPGAPPLEMSQAGRRLSPRELPMQRALKGETVTDQIMDVRRPDGREMTVLAKAAPLLDEGGQIRGAVGAFLDITALAAAEAALRKSETLLQQALDAANAGVWESVPETGEFRVSDRALALHGFPPGTQLTHELALEAVHPDDRKRVEEAIDRSVNTFAPFRVELRSSHPKDSVRWLSAMAEARVENGRIRLVGLVQDISERKRIEEALIEKERRLSLALSAGRLATWDWEPFQDEAIWNDAAFTLFGYRADDTKPAYSAWAARLHPEDRARVEQAFSKAVEQGGEFSDQYRILLPNGSIKWIEARGRMERKGDRTIRSYGVLIDTTEYKRAEEALREADRRKDEFLATLAHELRNPLAAIRNATYLLRRQKSDGAEADGKAQTLLGMVERQVNHLVRLVDDLLEVSRITTGKIVLRKERVELATLIRQTLQTIEPQLQNNEHEVHFHCSEPLVVAGDPVRLTQIFTNILTNATKYTPQYGNISVDVTAENGQAVVTIRDEGIGIVPEMLPTIFDLFAQSHRIAGRERGGIGVGLALSRRLVEMHGGTLQGHSDGSNRGSEFVVKLPLACSARPEQQISEPVELVNVPRQRALVIDDDRDVADSLALLLTHLGAETQVVYDGEKALRVVEDFKPDLIFLDLGMPGMDGFATAKSIKRLPHGASAKIVALTGWGQSADRARTREAGFDLHLTKPAAPDEVTAILQWGVQAREST